MNDLRVISISHRRFSLETIALFQLSTEQKAIRLPELRALLNNGELMYLNTCNRVEIIFTASHFVCPGLTSQFLQVLAPHADPSLLRQVAENTERYEGTKAGEHLLRVVSSLESVIIGEREIITQFRKAFEECRKLKLTGELLRIVSRQCVETAKEIFTNTNLARKPVSVVSVAWNEFRKKHVRKDAPVLLVGAGQVIRNVVKFLSENHYRDFTIANRTLSHAEQLAAEFGGNVMPLEELNSRARKFSVVITCTGSNEILVTAETFNVITSEMDPVIAIDLSLPPNIDPAVMVQEHVTGISLATVQAVAEANITFRKKSLEQCEPIIQNGIEGLEKIWQQRGIELAMRSIPEAIKDIRETAIGSVFAKELNDLDENSRELIERIMNYMEKKYISIPMKMAREVLLDSVNKN